METELNRQRSIARHIIDGSITIDSVSEFESMLKIFPNNPALYSAFGDLQVKKEMMDDAAFSYKKAAQLYIESGMMLSAILTKILEWRIEKPTHEEGRRFHASLCNGNFEETPLQEFFTSLSYPEMVAITNRLVRVRLPGNKVVKKIGDVDNSLYFIASGTISDTIYQPLGKKEEVNRKSTIYLSKNDFFGELFPFDEENLSKSYVETVTSVEMGKISKADIIEVCKNYPDTEKYLIKLFEDREKIEKKESLSEVRKADRRSLPLQMNLEIFHKGPDKPPLGFKGFSRDISIGGVCVVIDSKYANITSVINSIKDADVQLSFPSDAFTLTVSGNIIWSREVSFEGEKTLALGVHFRTLTPKMSGMLVVFADMLSNP